MKDHTYCLYIVDAAGDRTVVLDAEKSARRVRNVASKIKERPGRKVLITRDGKALPGGKSGLDSDLYKDWLKKNEKSEDDLPAFSEAGVDRAGSRSP